MGEDRGVQREGVGAEPVVVTVTSLAVPPVRAPRGEVARLLWSS